MRYYSYRIFGRPGGGWGGLPAMGLVTKRLLILNVVVFLLHALLFPASPGDPVLRWFALSSWGLGRGMLWQLVTYMFLHGGVWHLVANMLGLFFFGRELEERLGPRRFLYLYFGGGILGAVGWLLLGGLGLYSLQYPMIGASGAVFAVLGAYAALYPYRQVTLLLFFVIPVSMTARTMVLLFGGFSLLMLGDGTRIAHAAHLAGGLAGYVYGLRLAGAGGRRGATGNIFAGLRARWHWREMLARLRRSRLRVSRTPEMDGPVDWDRIDRILLKIKAHGFGGLDAAERAELERASRSAEQQRR